MLALVGAAAIWFVQAEGTALYYGDAAAHLNIARRLFDGRNPGYEQIGTVWLPIPHLVMMPFARVDEWWQNGLAGALPSGLAWVVAGTFLFALLRRIAGENGAIAGVAIFALQPNLLYLQATPMTEPLFLAGAMGMLLFSTRAVARNSAVDASLAGLCSIVTTLTRYEGWFVLPFVAIYLLWAGGKKLGVIFCGVAGLGPGYWLTHNWIMYSDPLEFYRGLGSAKDIQKGLPYPGAHDWWAAIQQFAIASKAVLGWPLIAMSVVGLYWARAAWPLFFCLLAPIFYVVNLHGGDSPIYVPEVYPFSHYNSRYALAGLPLCAILSGMLAGRWPRLRLILPLLAISWFATHAVIVKNEAKANSESRRAWTHEIAQLLQKEYQPGTGIWMPFGNLTAILQEAGIPIVETIHQGDKLEFDRNAARPDLFLDTAWVISQHGDDASRTMQRTPGFACVKLVALPYEPVIEVWRRVSP